MDRRAATERPSVRHWRPERDVPKDERRAFDPAEHLFKVTAGLRGGNDRNEVVVDVWVLDSEVAHLDVDAVISNDDVDGQMWSQAARSIRAAAGGVVEREAQADRPFRLGHAWATEAGELTHLESIIHVASVSRYGKPSPTDVDKCLKAAFRLAIRGGHESLGLSAFGTGPAAIPREEWFAVFAAATVELFDTAELLTEEEEEEAAEANFPESFSIVLALFEPREFEQDLERLREAFRDARATMNDPDRGVPEPLVQPPAT